METYSINALPSRLYLGKQTETGVRQVCIDCAPWYALWPDLVISIWARPPESEEAYPVVVKREGDSIIWTISDADTAVAGNGRAEIMGISGGLKKLSATISTLIRATITGTTADPPEPARPWVDQVLVAAERAEAAASAAEGSSGGKLDKDQGAENAGKLLYIGADGMLTLLSLGKGMAINDGVLTRVALAICGDALCDEINCGEV